MELEPRFSHISLMSISSTADHRFGRHPEEELLTCCVRNDPEPVTGARAAEPDGAASGLGPVASVRPAAPRHASSPPQSSHDFAGRRTPAGPGPARGPLSCHRPSQPAALRRAAPSLRRFGGRRHSSSALQRSGPGLLTLRQPLPAPVRRLGCRGARARLAQGPGAAPRPRLPRMDCSRGTPADARHGEALREQHQTGPPRDGRQVGAPTGDCLFSILWMSSDSSTAREQ